MLVNDMSWLPGIPNTGQKHDAPTLMHTREQLEDKSNWYPKGRTNDTKRLKLTVVNPQRNKKLENFTQMASIIFRTAIGKVGSPPTVEHVVPMCASYHLRGNCGISCTRRKDHAPHSQDEDC
jgi:hypothetical protein